MTQMTYRQRAYITHLVDTRERPQAISENGRTPGIAKWHTAEDVASRKVVLNSAQASELITWLLTRPEVAAAA